MSMKMISTRNSFIKHVMRTRRSMFSSDNMTKNAIRMF